MAKLYTDLDQMLHSVVYDLGLHCLSFTFFGVSRLKWVTRVLW